MTHTRHQNPPRTLHAAVKNLFRASGRTLGALDGNLPYQEPPANGAAAPGNAFMVISGSPGEGRTTVTAGMGWGLAPVARTLLVDAHTTMPGLSMLFGLQDEPGLAEVMNDGLDVESAIWPTDQPGLSVLPAGHAIRPAVGAQRRETFAQLVTSLRQDWDRVILDTPPFLDRPDASHLARHTDGAVLVVAAEQTHRAVASLVKERLEAAHGVLLGVVLNQRRLHIPNWIYRAL